MLFASIASAQDAEGRKHLLHQLGGPFIVYRNNVQGELKLSDEQKQRLQERLPAIIQETTQVFENFQGLQPEERKKAMQSFSQESGKKLWVFLQQTLTAEQLKRMQQLELQHEGPAALVGRPGIVKELQITNEERQQVMAMIQELQSRIEPLVREARSRGNPQEILPIVITIREEYDGKIEAILSAEQKKHWKEMRGKPFDVFNDN
ncbi:MAG TPA: hypothetical protein VHT02_08060 [Methylocella sp.]|nr:hypothetical protein [Methylocella sp.]